MKGNLGLRDVHVSTINKELLEAGLASYKTTKKPKILGPGKAKRIEWSTKHKNFSTNDWEKWIFSDESYNVMGYNAHSRVRRGAGESLLQDCIDGTTKWGTKIMFWGAFFVGGVSDLVFIEGTMDSDVYIQVLKEGLFPLYRRHGLDKKEYTFQEDGDPKHQSKKTKDWKEKQGLKFLTNWPPNSPDLNPIENLWSILKRRVGAREPSTVEEAKAYLLEEWRRLEADSELERLIHSMVDRCAAVIKSKGNPTKY